MRTLRCALPAGLLLLAVAAPGASAATVQVDTTACDPRYGTGCQRDVRFTAVPGERNDVTIIEAATGELLVRDAGAPVQAGPGCRQVAAGEAICLAAPVTLVLGDGDDAAALAAQLGLLEGGDGDDRLTGGAGDDTLTGGPGADELHGGEGNDRLDDLDTAPATDVFDGGPGADTVSYALRSTAIGADLARGYAGALDERDMLVGIEGIIGGGGADRIVGSAGDDDLDGGGGRDRISGMAGADRLQGGRRTDRLDGGDGDDELIGTVDSGEVIPRLRRGQDFLRCGDGRDRVERADQDDIVVSGCEAVAPEQGLFLLEHPLRPVLEPRKLTSPVLRIASAVYAGRRVVLRLHLPYRRGRGLGRTVVVRDGAGQRSVRLNARGRALLARQTSMRVGVAAFERGGDRDEIARFRMVLRRPAGG